MTHHLLRTALSVLIIPILLVGCTRVKEAEQPHNQEELHEVVFHAGWAPETRTELQKDGSVWWSPGDEIGLFTGPGTDGGYQFFATITEPSPKSDFVGEIDKGNLFSAIYPYDDHDSFDGTDFVVFFNDQVAQEGTFAKRSFKSIAQSTDEHLFFKNICGGIKFSVVNEGITHLVLQADCAIGGALKFHINEGGEPEYSGVSASGGGGFNELVVFAPDKGSFEPHKDYYIVLPALAIPDGIKISFYRGGYYALANCDDYAEWSYSNPVEIHRSAFKRLDSVDKDLKFHKMNYDNTAFLYQFLPKDIDRGSITKIKFHVKDETVTDHRISASEPVYYDVNGTVVNIYTSAELYDISYVTVKMFDQFSALKELDLSNTVVPFADSFFAMFRNCISLESIIFGDWDTYKVENMDAMFGRCEKLRSLDLSFMDTGNVTSMSSLFSNCTTLTAIDVSSFDTRNVTSMGGMFSGFSGTSLDLSSFDTRNVTSMGSMFSQCKMLQELDLSNFDTSNVEDMNQMFFECLSLKQLNISSFDTSNVENFNSMFYNCGLENLDLSHFVTSKAQDMLFMFGWCTSLKNLDVSSFTSESLQTAELMFGSCQRLQTLDLGAFDLSQTVSQNIGQAIMRTSKSGAIRCLPETRAVLEPTMDENLAGKVEWMSLDDDIGTYEYQRDPNLYFSTDFSKHETVRKLYSATKGKGIDIVLMGDVYSDRMIASGLYDEDMELAADAIFSKEPMVSFKDYFNVYIVYLVSDNEVIGESTALDAIESGTGILEGSVSATVPSKYRILATGNGDLTVQEAIVIVNGTSSVTGYANMTAWDFDVDYYDCDYGRGYSSVVLSRGSRNNSEEFQRTVIHEFGHSFAKLADEYYDESTSPDCPESISSLTDTFNRFGWYKNVDVVSDPATIRWSVFLSDDRYAEDGVGVFEGGATYSQGVWRPSFNSIMRYGTEFNAPSRAAIYNRIHKLAYGKDWQFDYEDFVQWDSKNIGLENRALRSNAKGNHPHSRQKPILQVQKEKTEDGHTLYTVIMH